MRPSTDEELPHVEALQRAIAAGFVYVRLHDNNLQLDGLAAQRWRSGILDKLHIRGMDEASASRHYAPTGPAEADAKPVWTTTGTVADVITQLLDLPDHIDPTGAL